MLKCETDTVKRKTGALEKQLWLGSKGPQRLALYLWQYLGSGGIFYLRIRRQSFGQRRHVCAGSGTLAHELSLFLGLSKWLYFSVICFWRD